MACGATLKRSHDFDPLHSPGRSPKRMCMLGELISPRSQTVRLPTSSAAFAEAAHKFVNDQIAARLSPRLGHQASQFQMGPVLTGRSSQFDRLNLSLDCMAPSSPQSARSIGVETGTFRRRPAPTAAAVPTPVQVSKVDRPMITLKQVDFVCKRMVQDHEERCREEFDKVLSNKLAEQYEAFLKFNHSQLSKKFDDCDASYVS